VQFHTKSFVLGCRKLCLLTWKVQAVAREVQFPSIVLADVCQPRCAILSIAA
jgi:hypothetical protein